MFQIEVVNGLQFMLHTNLCDGLFLIILLKIMFSRGYTGQTQLLKIMFSRGYVGQTQLLKIMFSRGYVGQTQTKIKFSQHSLTQIPNKFPGAGSFLKSSHSVTKEIPCTL
jgi:hypothetical protein